MSGIIITPGLAPSALNPRPRSAGEVPGPPASDPRRARQRTLTAVACVATAFAIVAGQLVRLAVEGQSVVQVSMSAPMATAFARPDIVDRNGRLLASDVSMPSLFADPSVIIDRDEVVEKLVAVLPGLDGAQLRANLADRSKRFLWVRRGLSPQLAQRVHELGLPGLHFRTELRRAYPAGQLAGHALGRVDVDNRGLEGIERHIDEAGHADPVHGASLSSRLPVRLSLDLAVQHAVEEELALAMARYQARAAAGVVLDVATGEVVAMASLPGTDPILPEQALEPERRDRAAGGIYELGSIFKAFTVALGIEEAGLEPDSVIDVRQPLEVDGYTIKDLHPAGRELTLTEVFTHSSNIGSGKVGLAAGSVRQRAFLERLGLVQPMRTEAGPIAVPRLPQRSGDVETVTLSYGHGLAVSPLQFAAAAAALVNGGVRVVPTLLRQEPAKDPRGERVLSEKTSAALRLMMRENVAGAGGTGRRAEVPGLEIGGKTGTAEIPGPGGYQKTAVISSFLAAFPMSAPRYVVLVSLFEPQPVEAAGHAITAGRNAAPTSGRIIGRIAPLLGVLPGERRAAL